jgi:hypothetical protein
MAPGQCTAEKLNSFYDLVSEGEQVNLAGLPGRIKACRMLGFAYEGTKLVAVTALKVPGENYKNKIFSSAGVADLSPGFNSEMGYAFTMPEFRAKGIHQQLVAGLIRESGEKKFYATTKAANVPYILEKMGFKKAGNSYTNESEELLHLYTYDSDMGSAAADIVSRECIICREMKTDFNEEHVFPATIGGGFVIKLVCSDCNSSLGEVVDTPFVSHKQILLYRHELGLSRQGRPIKNPLGGTYTGEDGKKFIVRKTESGFRAEVKHHWQIEQTDEGPIGRLTLSENFMGSEEKLVEKYAKKLEEETGFKFERYEKKKLEGLKYTVDEITSDNPFIMGCLKIGYETAAAFIAGYVKDELAIAYSKMLQVGELNRELKEYINPDHSLTREVATVLNKHPLLVGFHCLAALLNVEGKGLVAGVKIFDMFYCFILSTKENYIDDRVLLVLNDSIKERNYSFFIKQSVKFDLTLESEMIESQIAELTQRAGDAQKLFTGTGGLTALYDTNGNVVMEHVDHLMYRCFGTFDYSKVAGIREMEFEVENAYIRSESGLLYRLKAVKLYF